MRSCVSVAVFFAARVAFADGGEALLAKARTVEAAQLAALAGTTLTMQTTGASRSGKAAHPLAAERRLAIARDGGITNDFVSGTLDGRRVDEAGLRAGTGAPPKPPGQAEALTVALAPLTSPDVSVGAMRAAADGVTIIRCDVHRKATIDWLDVAVGSDGKKRWASLHPAGTMVKMADRAELTLTYADDGTPAKLESHFAAKVLWVDRAVDMVTVPVKRERN
jgi:hypothetical protein